MYRPFLDEVAEKIRESKDIKPILYLITEDQEVIHNLLAREDCFEVMGQDGIVPYEKGKIFENLSFYYGHAPSPTGNWDKYFRFVSGPQYHIVLDWQLTGERFGRIGLQKDIVTQYIDLLGKEEPQKRIGKNLVLVASHAPGDSIPKGYEQYVHVIDVPLIGMYEIAELVVQKQNMVLRNIPGINVSELTVEKYLKDPDVYAEFLKGMRRKEIQYVLDTLHSQFGVCSVVGLTERYKQSLYDVPGEKANRLDKAARKHIFSLKQQMVSMDGSLSFLDTEGIVRPGGMEGLEAWLLQVKGILDDPQRAEKYAVKFPKGILLAGLPGSGKSLLAKYVSNILDVPLIQFNMSSVLNSLVGETETKLKQVLKLIEASAPCVVWIDEIEKELPNKDDSGKGDSGVSKRCLATILNWMQENKKQCFICATANHIGSLPSELLRRGRFERKYYTFLPMQRQCVEILIAHLVKAAKDTSGVFDKSVYDPNKKADQNRQQLEKICNKAFDKIAEMPRKFFTGADIEGLVQDIKMLIFDEFDKNLPYNAERLEKLLVYVARKSKPYGETNFQETVEYWCDMQKNPFLNVGVPELSGMPNDLEMNSNQSKIYEYIPFDFTDLLFDGKTWTWRKDLKCMSDKKYDQNMFNELKDPILQQMNMRVQKR